MSSPDLRGGIDEKERDHVVLIILAADANAPAVRSISK
jgi:hypothetical protein